MKNWKRKIILFLTSQGISLFGSSLVQFAIIWYITLKTQSGIMMTIATLCGLIPQVIISPFAGVWSDYYNKKKIIMLADGMIALVTLTIAILFFLDINYIWLLFIALIVRSLGSGIQTPSVTAFIPEITPENHLMRVNSINSTVQSSMLIVAPAVAGLLLANVEVEYIFLIDVITAIIGIGIFLSVKYKFKKKREEKVDYFSSIKDGINYVKNNKFLSKSLIYLIVFNFLITPVAALSPLLVTRTFGENPMYLTLNETFFFIGAVIGGVLLSTWGGFKNRIKTVGYASLVCGMFAIIMGLAYNLIFYLFCIIMLGMTIPFMNTPFVTLFQEKVETEKQGRIFSLVTVISGAIIPFGMIIFGPLADIIKIQYLVLSTGILFMITAITLIKNKTLKKIAEPKEKIKMEEKRIDVVGTLFFKDGKLLIDKPRKRPTYQMVGGSVEEGENFLDAAIRECCEELGDKAIFNKKELELILEFDEVATSNPNLKIRMHIFKYNGQLDGDLTLSEEIENFMWFGINDDKSILSNTLKNEIIPYAIENNLIY